MTMVNENLHLREVGNMIGVSHVTVQRYLQAEGYVYRADVWVQSQRTSVSAAYTRSVCNYKRNEEPTFL